METIFDWLTIGIFFALVALFLQRSIGANQTDEQIVHYLPPAVACAAANYLGNLGWSLVAVALMTATAAYIGIVLKPMGHGNRA